VKQTNSILNQFEILYVVLCAVRQGLASGCYASTLHNLQRRLLLFSAALKCFCMHNKFVKLVCTHGVTCLVIMPCSVVVLVIVTLLLLCAIKLCALHACIPLPFLLFVADQPFSATCSCCGCAAGLIEYNWLGTATTDTVLETFILHDHADYWR
jgi:hypothetical protein